METVVLKSTRYNCHIFFGESICLWRQRRVQDKNCGHNFVPALYKKVKLGNSLRILDSYIQRLLIEQPPLEHLGNLEARIQAFVIKLLLVLVST